MYIQLLKKICALISLIFTSITAQAYPILLCGHEQDPSIYQNLNYGLYWFADTHEHAYCTQDIHNTLFFNPHKPHTLIFVHGWLPYSVIKQKRFNFNAEDISGPHVTDMIAPWLQGASGDKKPWNVGVFYWNQFSDESVNDTDTYGLMEAVKNAEAKIWSTTDRVGIRWRDSSNKLHALANNKQQTLSDLFYENYVDSLKNYEGDIRLVGASLGSQLMIATAKKIDDAVQSGALPHNLLPRQIILLDPVITDVHHSLHMKTLIADVLQLEQDGVIISGYRTSILGDSLLHTDDNTDLLKYTAFSEINPCSYSHFSLMARHTAGIWWYLLSYNLQKVPLSNNFNSSAPFANLPENQLRKLMSPTAPAFQSDALRNNIINHLCQSDSLTIEWRKWQMKEVSKHDL